MAPRSALLIIGLQNEFLDPEAGRCVMASMDPGRPSFVDKLKAFVLPFRDRGGDVIWVRSEYQKPRDFVDPRNDETVLIISDDSDSDSGADYDAEETGIIKELGGVEGARPPLRTDAFLAVESDHPPCAPATPASEFHPSVQASITSPPDRVMVKTWFSAFKETPLLQILRGRFISDLYICGVITNVCILATAADAAKHGFNVFVMPDCLGYRNFVAHQQSLKVMVDDYGVEEVRSGQLIKGWEKEMRKKKLKAEGTDSAGSKGSQLGAISFSNEELVKMVAGIRMGEVVGRLGGVVEQPEEEEEAERTTIPGDITPITVVPPTAASSSNYSNPMPKQTLVQRSIKRNGGAEAARKVKMEKDATEAQKGKNPAEVEVGKKEEGGEGGWKEKKPRENRKKKSNAGKDSGKAKGATRNVIAPSAKFDSKAPIMKAGDVLGEGDSKLVNSILPRFLAKVAFDKLKKEVSWRTMYHRGGEVPRMVAVEGDIDEDGSFPVYRHPADESPPLQQFTPTVNLIRGYVQEVLKHPINHVLIQHYRDGNDYISEHSDKTLDIVRGSFIVNVSLGAQRTMILRTKKDAARESAAESTTQAPLREGAGPERKVQRIPLPHNSMFVLGLESNKKWLHGIRQDRRESFLKTPEEMASNGERISLTFRHIGTFLSSDESEIYGQGAVSKSKDDPRPVINGNHPDTEKLIQAFGSENHQSDFDWDASYGAGFDVLHFVPQLPRLFFAAGDVQSNRVRICLAEKGIEYTPHELQPNEVNTPSFRALNPRGTAPVLVDVDRERTTVCESLAILQYLEISYPSNDPEKFLLPHPVDERAAFALVLQIMQESERLASILAYGTTEEKENELAIWDGYLRKTEKYVMGDDISLADIAVWPVVDRFVGRSGWNLNDKYSALAMWRNAIASRKSVKGLVEVPKAVEERRQVDGRHEGTLDGGAATLETKEENTETLEEMMAKLGVE